jgi:hypothetical protein
MEAAGMTGTSIGTGTTAGGSPQGGAAPLSPLARIAGPAALLAGVVIVVTQLVQLATLDRDDKAAMFDNPVYVTNGVVQFVALNLLLVALVAAHRWQEEEAGTFGTVALVTALVGTLGLAGNYWFEAFVSPWAADALPGYLDTEPSGLLPVGGLTSYVLFAVGWVLFGWAALRAGVFPRAVSIAVIVGGVVAVQMVQPPLGVPLGLALAWLGVWMLRSGRT